MDSTLFYRTLSVADAFVNVTETTHYRSLPDDWHVAVADIVDSTGAIERGKYREVNILGASLIAGVLNAARADDVLTHSDVPFSFGGDGAIVCVPPRLAEDTRNVLAAIQPIATETYDLHIRTALVPVTYICTQGRTVRVARLRLSEHFDQAVFIGGGLAATESALKSNQLPERFDVAPAESPERADFTGLQCRWQRVPPDSGEIVSLLVQANAEVSNVYREVLRVIRDIFGEDPRPHPITPSNLKLGVRPKDLMREIKLHSFGANWFERMGTLLKTQMQSALGRMLMHFETETTEIDWGTYRSDLRRNSDYRKFDDMLRLVITGSTEQREALEAFLEERYNEETLVYGLHVSDAAIITCMVLQYQHRHLHFVDGHGGGYALAAKDLRERAGIQKT